MSPSEQYRALRRFLIILDCFSHELASVRAQLSLQCGPTEFTLLRVYLLEAKLKLIDIRTVTDATSNFRGMTVHQRSALQGLIGDEHDLDQHRPDVPADTLATFLSPRNVPTIVVSCEDGPAIVVSPEDAPATICSRRMELEEAVKEFEELLAKM